MLRCAILDDYQGTALERGDFGRFAGAITVDVFREHIAETEALVARLADYEIIVAMRERTPFDAARLKRLPKLKLLVTTGPRNAAIDLDAARACGIVVSGTSGSSGSAAELTWGLLLALVRHIPQEVANLRQGGSWQVTVGRDLAGMTLGVIGLGTLGKRMAVYGKAFGMTVVAWSRSLTAEQAASLGIGHAPDLDTLLGLSDVVSVHVPLNGETRGMIGAREIGLMRPGTLLLNSARGPIVDEAALVAGLRSGQIGGAGLDVFDREPLPADHPFRSLPTVIATPHLGYVTERTYDAYFAGIVEAIAGWHAGAPIRVLT